MSNKLPTEIKQYNNIPVKAIPVETMQRFELPFMNYLSRLLNLKADNAENLEMCVPVILDLNRNYSFEQISEMFTLYADSKLNIEPISNYIDRILIGKIKNAYIDYLNKSNRKKKILKKDINGNELNQEQAYKREMDIVQAGEWFDSFLHLDKIKPSAVWVYDFLEAEGVIDYQQEDKNIIYTKFKNDKGMSKQDAIKASKLQLLKTYFNFLRSKSLHLHSVLKF